MLGLVVLSCDQVVLLTGQPDIPRGSVWGRFPASIAPNPHHRQMVILTTAPTTEPCNRKYFDITQYNGTSIRCNHKMLEILFLLYGTTLRVHVGAPRHIMGVNLRNNPKCCFVLFCCLQFQNR